MLCAGGTQTVLTFPFAYDLEKLLSGTNFCFTEDDNVRDISNSSLRRKLFGQPDRQVGEVILCHSHSPAKEQPVACLATAACVYTQHVQYVLPFLVLAVNPNRFQILQSYMLLL